MCSAVFFSQCIFIWFSKHSDFCYILKKIKYEYCNYWKCLLIIWIYYLEHLDNLSDATAIINSTLPYLIIYNFYIYYCCLHKDRLLQADGGSTVRTQCLTNLWAHHTMLGLYSKLKVLVIMKIIPYVSAIFNPPEWKWYFETGRLNIKMVFVMLKFNYFCYLWIFKLSGLQKKGRKNCEAHYY